MKPSITKTLGWGLPVRRPLLSQRNQPWFYADSLVVSVGWAGGLSCTMSALKVCWSTYGMVSTTAIPPPTMHQMSVGPMHPRLCPA